MDIFDKAYFSFMNSVSKPDPTAYRQVINDFNVKPKDILFIDDSQMNLDSAQNLGINTVLFKSSSMLIGQLKAIMLH